MATAKKAAATKAAAATVEVKALQVAPGPEQQSAVVAARDALDEVRALLATGGGKLTADTYTKAGKLYLAAREAKDRAWERFSQLIDPLNVVRNQLLEARRTAVAPAEEAIDLVKRAIDGYDAEVRRVAEEAARRAREEALAEERRQREAAAAAARAEEERLRKEREAQIAKAKEEGDKAKAKQLAKLPDPVVAPAPVAPVTPQFGPEVVAEPPRVAGVSKRVRWTFEITDAAAVKRDFCKPDEAAIRKVVEAMGERAPGIVGGIVVRQETSLVRR